MLRRKTREAIPLVIVGIKPDTDPEIYIVGQQECRGRQTRDREAQISCRVLPDLARQLVNVDFPFPAENAFYLAVSQNIKPEWSCRSMTATMSFQPSLKWMSSNKECSCFQGHFLKAMPQLAVDPNDTVGAFARVAPLMTFVRYCAGEQGWHATHHYANLTIDDPWLREPYGYLDYKDLLQEMDRHNFHTTIALFHGTMIEANPTLFRSFGITLIASPSVFTGIIMTMTSLRSPIQTRWLISTVLGLGWNNSSASRTSHMTGNGFPA